MAALAFAPSPGSAQDAASPAQSALPVTVVSGGPAAGAPSDVVCPASRPGMRQGRPGAAANRACAIEFLVAQRRQSLTAFDAPAPDQQDRAELNAARARQWRGLLAGSEMLRNFYLARGEGGQFIHDRGAELAGIGGTGAALSTASSAGTVATWGYVALASVLVVSFTGSKPRGDLYHAGHLGVGFIENRYMVLMNHSVALDSAPPGNAACSLPSDNQGGQRGLGVILEQLGKVEAWPDAADRAAFLPVLRSLAEVCSAVNVGERQITEMAGRLNRADRLWSAAYADDLLALDARVERADVLLRPVPAAALTGAASGTLRALDGLISGQNPQEAVNRISTNALLDSMTVSLTPIHVGTPPRPVEASVVISSELMARVTHVGRAARDKPSDSRADTRACRCACRRGAFGTAGPAAADDAEVSGWSQRGECCQSRSSSLTPVLARVWASTRLTMTAQY
ncbi:MAG: hypothetical protein AAGC50_00265, partial [Pseudomonadota bacterium]